MKKVFLLFVISLLSINSFGQEKTTLLKKLGWIYVRNMEGLIGFIDSKGKEVVPMKYANIDSFGEYKDDWARVENEQGLIGFIDSKGKEIVPTKYLRVYPFGEDKENWAKVMIKDELELYGYINLDGKEIVKPIYTKILVPK
ncbi:WG repeat-containing protein [Flavobacterium gilvum]|uniref:WG repeat-containing protein n=1 Tax=Flavobacterium gilvum TaxID=1492737 RepID=A0AAC9I5X5_9FLAO|nr:WG repeat-containing protein [Flavobacterium gilvum]AOW08492.1 hypothetical protein EM308_02700 [Flavobacterium gilvum]KFC58210.1 hypothetical protein FEM08_29800 [Flavobacterium gilvum]